MVKVALLDGHTTGLGLKLALVRDGSPVTLRLIEPEGFVTAMSIMADDPRETLVDDAESENTWPVTSTEKVAECSSLPLVPVTLKELDPDVVQAFTATFNAASLKPFFGGVTLDGSRLHHMGFAELDGQVVVKSTDELKSFNDVTVTVPELVAPAETGIDDGAPTEKSAVAVLETQLENLYEPMKVYQS